MADANAPKKKFWKWIWEDVIVAFVAATGLEALVKTLGPKIPNALSEMLGAHLKGKILNDRRAELLEDFRIMRADGENIDNLIRRHKKSIKELKESKFVELLSKIPVNQTDPTKGRQATLKYLNDLSDKEFDQMLYFLDHDVVLQWLRQIAKIIKKIFDDLKATLKRTWQSARTHLGIWGEPIETAGEATWNSLVRFFHWMNGTWLRIAVVAVISLPVVILGAIFIGLIRQRFFLGVLAVIGILAWIYFALVPRSVEHGLLFAFLMSLTLLLCFWGTVLARTILFLFVIGIALIFFLRDGNAVPAKAQTIWAALNENRIHEAERIDQAKINDLQSKVLVRNEELATLQKKESRHQIIPSNQANIVVAQDEEQPPIAAKEEVLDPLSGILPISGDEGPLLVKMQGCWYSQADVMTCRGFLFNRESRQRRIYLMDSEGVADNGNESRHFNVWSFGGSIKFDGGGNVAMLIPQTRNTFLITFAEPEGGVTTAGLTLNIEGDDAINHPYVFANIPIITYQ